MILNLLFNAAAEQDTSLTFSLNMFELIMFFTDISNKLKKLN